MHMIFALFVRPALDIVKVARTVFTSVAAGARP
jgi:hypothetical protein